MRRSTGVSGRLLAVVLAVPIALAGIAGCGGSTPQPANKAVDQFSCLTDVPSDTSVLLRESGAPFDGVVVGHTGPGIVFANQVDGDLCQWYPEADLMARKGYRTLAFNYSVVDPPDKDVLAAADVLRKRGAKQVFLIGASKGGTAVLGAAARANPAVDGVVSLSGPASFAGVDALSAVAGLTTPALFVVGRYDEPFATDAGKLYAACRSPDKALEPQDNGAHGVALMDDHVRGLITAFMSRHR